MDHLKYTGSESTHLKYTSPRDVLASFSKEELDSILFKRQLVSSLWNYPGAKVL